MSSGSRPRVDGRRVHVVRGGPEKGGPVVYWMVREQRVGDNWAFLHAQQVAGQGARPLAVVFCLARPAPDVGARHGDFMLRGLREVERELSALAIPFYLLPGEPDREIAGFCARVGAGALVTDFDPLNESVGWKEKAAASLACPFYEVDAHNIVPCRVASEKAEYAARTFRPKVNRLLPELLTEFPRPRRQVVAWPAGPVPVDWDRARAFFGAGEAPGPPGAPVPGGKAGRRAMRAFLGERLAAYSGARNDPNLQGQSGLSPYLHFGQLSAQRVALETEKAAGDSGAGDVFLEELIVRRELSDNFCHYNPAYDSFGGFPDWARRSLEEHRRDRRAYLYPLEAFERAETHDELWNAAQRQLLRTGRMHGYLRMYWAKKILEWSVSPEEAMRVAVALNDRYELDGRDPNGYAGIAWSIGGVHDRPWFERPVFGKVRYMSESGCRRKFDVESFIRLYPPG